MQASEARGVTVTVDSAGDAGSGAQTGGSLLRTLKESDAIAAESKADELLIDIVALMFDFILDDPNIAAPIRSLVGRLQIPMLKVAILDKDFFNKKNHPARKLLESISSASLGWSENPPSAIQRVEPRTLLPSTKTRISARTQAP